MRVVRDVAIKHRQEQTYYRLIEEDAIRSDNPKAKLPFRFTQSIDDFLEFPKHKSAKKLFDNRTARGTAYEKRTYQQIAKNRRTDYSLLKSLIQGPKPGHYQAELGKISTRLELIEDYFSTEFDISERTLTVEQAEDLKTKLQAKADSQYWKRSEREGKNTYRSDALKLIEHIDNYISTLTQSQSKETGLAEYDHSITIRQPVEGYLANYIFGREMEQAREMDPVIRASAEYFTRKTTIENPLAFIREAVQKGNERVKYKNLVGLEPEELMNVFQPEIIETGVEIASTKYDVPAHKVRAGLALLTEAA